MVRINDSFKKRENVLNRRDAKYSSREKRHAQVWPVLWFWYLTLQTSWWNLIPSVWGGAQWKVFESCRRIPHEWLGATSRYTGSWFISSPERWLLNRTCTPLPSLASSPTMWSLHKPVSFHLPLWVEAVWGPKQKAKQMPAPCCFYSLQNCDLINLSPL